MHTQQIKIKQLYNIYTTRDTYLSPGSELIVNRVENVLDKIYLQKNGSYTKSISLLHILIKLRLASPFMYWLPIRINLVN